MVRSGPAGVGSKPRYAEHKGYEKGYGKVYVAIS